MQEHDQVGCTSSKTNGQLSLWIPQETAPRGLFPNNSVFTINGRRIWQEGFRLTIEEGRKVIIAS
jgi:hypothetical protein